MTLAEFLLARIAEDEAVARKVMQPVSGQAPDDQWQAHRTSAGDEVVITAKRGNGWRSTEVLRYNDVTYHLADHIARHDPARVLAVCEAKRRIVALHDHVVQDGEPDLVCTECSDRYEGPFYRGPCQTVRLLALPYADHSDYDEAWRP